MYTTPEFRVRDARAPYGPGPSTPSFPAAGVLADLSTVDDEGLPLVLARYAALRCWVLLEPGVDPALSSHARAAADHHLDTLAEGAERSALRRLIRRPEPLGDALRALHAASRAAEGVGHGAGALALRQAALDRAVRRLDHGRAAAVARGVAGLFARLGRPAEAARWRREAERLRGLRRGWLPPSIS